MKYLNSYPFGMKNLGEKNLAMIMGTVHLYYYTSDLLKLAGYNKLFDRLRSGKLNY